MISDLLVEQWTLIGDDQYYHSLLTFSLPEIQIPCNRPENSISDERASLFAEKKLGACDSSNLSLVSERLHHTFSSAKRTFKQRKSAICHQDTRSFSISQYTARTKFVPLEFIHQDKLLKIKHPSVYSRVYSYLTACKLRLGSYLIVPNQKICSRLLHFPRDGPAHPNCAIPPTEKFIIGSRSQGTCSSDVAVRNVGGARHLIYFNIERDEELIPPSVALGEFRWSWWTETPFEHPKARLMIRQERLGKDVYRRPEVRE